MLMLNREYRAILAGRMAGKRAEDRLARWKVRHRRMHDWQVWRRRLTLNDEERITGIVMRVKARAYVREMRAYLQTGQELGLRVVG